MATIAENIAALETALASGVTVVSIDGRRTEYRSVSELKAAIEHFKAQERAQTGRRAVSVSVGAYHRG